MKHLLQKTSAVRTHFVYLNTPAPAPASEPDVPEHLAETIAALETVESSVRDDLASALNQLLPAERARQGESVQALLTLLEREDSMEQKGPTGRLTFIIQFNRLWKKIPDNLKTQIESSIETIDVAEVVASVESEILSVRTEAQNLLNQGTSNEDIQSFIETRTASIMGSVLGMAEGLDVDLQNQILASQTDFLSRMGITVTPDMTLTEALTALEAVDFTDAIRASLVEEIQQAEVPTEAELNNIMARLEGLSSRLHALDGSATETGVETAVLESLMGEFNAWWRHNEQAVVALAQAGETEDMGMLQQLSMVLDNFMGNGVQGLDSESALGYALRGVDGVSANALDPATLQAAFLSGGAEALRTQIETILRAKVTAAITPENFQSIVEDFSGIDENVADQEALLALLQQVPEHWSEARIQQYQEYVEATGRGALQPLAWRAQEISKISPAFMQALAELMDKLGPILAQFRDIFKPDESDTGAARTAAIGAVETNLTGLRNTAETESAFLAQRSTVTDALQTPLSNGRLRIAELPANADDAAVMAFMNDNFPNASAAEDLTVFNNLLESSDPKIVAARAFGLKFDTLMALAATANDTVAIEGDTIAISVPVEGQDTPSERRFTRNADGRLTTADETELLRYLEGGSAPAEVVEDGGGESSVEVSPEIQGHRDALLNLINERLIERRAGDSSYTAIVPQGFVEDTWGIRLRMISPDPEFNNIGGEIEVIAKDDINASMYGFEASENLLEWLNLQNIE